MLIRCCLANRCSTSWADEVEEVSALTASRCGQRRLAPADATSMFRALQEEEEELAAHPAQRRQDSPERKP